jgi:hypothetical protein
VKELNMETIPLTFITTLAKRINNCCGLLGVVNTHQIFEFAIFLEEMTRFTLTKLASKI